VVHHGGSCPGEGPSCSPPCDIVLEDGTTLSSEASLPPDLPTGYHRLIPLDGGPPTELVVHPATSPRPGRIWGVAAQIYSLWSEGSWGIGDLADVAVLARVWPLPVVTLSS
jgi:4-alpha-glucanotransferase